MLKGRKKLNKTKIPSKGWFVFSKAATIIGVLAMVVYSVFFLNLSRFGWAPESLKVKKAYAVGTLRPSADGTYTNWTPAGAGSHYVEVYEVTPDEDGTYISENSANSRDSFNLPDGQIPTGAEVNQIQVYARAKNVHGSKDATFKIFYRKDAADTDGATSHNPPNSSYGDYSETWSGLSWGPSDIDGLEIGVLLDALAPGSSLNVTQMYIEVSYYAIENLQTDCTGQNCDQNGQSFNISADMDNQTAGNITNSCVDYTVYIDDNPADGVPSANEGYASSTGSNCDGWAESGADSNTTYQKTSLDVSAGTSQNDSWGCENTNFPSITTYSIYAKWWDCASATYDTSNSTFSSVPTLGWFLLIVALGIVVFLAWRKGLLKTRRTKLRNKCPDFKKHKI